MNFKEEVRRTKGRGDSAYGRTDHEELLLEVCDAYPLSNQQETLLHEVLHAVTWHTGYNSSWDALMKGSPDDMEEHVVNSMSLVLFNLLKQNPILMAWLVWVPPVEVVFVAE